MENKTQELIQDCIDGFDMAEDDSERALAGARLCGVLEMILLFNQIQEERK